MIALKDFIKQTLKDIREAKEEESFFEGVRGVIEFDVATLADESGKAGVKVGVLGIGGEIGGVLSSQTTSRIRFSVQTKGAISPGESYRPGKGRVVNY